MRIFALADLHLSLSCPQKDMAVFGSCWQDYMVKIAQAWNRVVRPQDVVLVAGDISWAMKPEQAKIDLDWLDALTGKKVLIKGNHDYWWGSQAKVQSILGPSLVIAERKLVELNATTAVVGTRLWDVPGVSFNDYIDWKPNARAKESEMSEKDSHAIFEKEFYRLEHALKLFSTQHTTKIVMTHYPPVNANLEANRVSALLEQYGVSWCVFGHLHSLKPNVDLFGTARGIHYIFSACDAFDFTPRLLFEV